MPEDKKDDKVIRPLAFDPLMDELEAAIRKLPPERQDLLLEALESEDAKLFEKANGFHDTETQEAERIPEEEREGVARVPDGDREGNPDQ